MSPRIKSTLKVHINKKTMHNTLVITWFVQTVVAGAGLEPTTFGL